MSKRKSFIWIVLFLIALASPPFTFFFLGPYIDAVNYENRNIEAKPVLTLKNYVSFPQEYETYYNDNIPFRNQLIQLTSKIDFFLFRQSSNDNVDIGKGGWLFYCNDEDHNPVEQSLGYWHFTQEELRTIAENLVVTKESLNKKGIEFVLFIAPNKETIYGDYLPDYYQVRNNYTSTDQMVDYLRENTDIRVVYPKEELLEMRRENPDIVLYHKLDTHWNFAGGYIGANSLARELGIGMPLLSEVTIEQQFASSGDLTNMLNISIENGDIDYNITNISALNTENEKWDFLTEFIYHTPGADQRKLFVCRDSFATSLAPALATQFEESLWVHGSIFEQQRVLDYNTNIFVYETVERYENSLLNFRILY